MKILKLTAIFLVLVGGLFIAINWDAIFVVKEREENFVDEDLIDISGKCDEIRKSWASQTGWNEQAYRIQRDDIDQSKALGMFSLEGYNTVNNCLRETVTNKACEGYVAALHKHPFSEAELQKQLKGVVLLQSEEHLSEDSRVLRILQLDKLYNAIHRFSQSSHVIRPSFNTETMNWTSFTSSQNSILSTARSLRGNVLFKEMEDVPGFKDALDEARLQKETETQRKSFYGRLSSQIVACFQTVEATQESLDQLNQVYKDFLQEEKTYGVDELATALVDLKEKVEMQ